MSAIADHAPIGDCRSAALVSRRGEIDWLCWPRFDSPSLFGALLDAERGGRFAVTPSEPFVATRRYLEDTNVLETRFRIADGEAVLVDVMPVADPDDPRARLLPDHELLRICRCERGRMPLEIVYDPRPGYGAWPCRLLDTGPLGLRLAMGAGVLTLRSTVPLVPGDRGARARVVLSAGESLELSLSDSEEAPARLPLLGPPAREILDASIACWRGWAGRTRYDGPYPEAVRRSALVLKLLAHAPSGAIVAAPTTSLPERLGGDLNWDYRYCWLRDASFTARALFGLGHAEEGAAFVNWVIHTTRLTRPRLRVLYDVFGERVPPERILPDLRGHAGSRPVRIGNAAQCQLQLDLYGEVVDAAWQYVQAGGRLDRETSAMLRAFGRYVCQHWQEPDEGIWEPRTGRRPHTHSRLLCWTALDRLIDLAARGRLAKLDRDRAVATREAIRREIETLGWNERVGAYTQTLGGTELDATALLLPWYGFEPASSARMRATLGRIREQLGTARGLLYRYRTGESPGEGAFGVASFWVAECLALGCGSAAEATLAFEQVLACANDVGLYGEEIDPQTGQALGNFPQAFTHVGLINAALSLEERRRAGRDLAGRRRGQGAGSSPSPSPSPWAEGLVV